MGIAYRRSCPYISLSNHMAALKMASENGHRSVTYQQFVGPASVVMESGQKGSWGLYYNSREILAGPQKLVEGRAMAMVSLTMTTSSMARPRLTRCCRRWERRRSTLKHLQLSDC